MDQDKDLYAILGITKAELDADPAILKKAFRRAAQAAHSDQNGGDDAKMKDVNLANSILSDPEKRRIYDETGSSQTANGYRAEIERAFAMMFLDHLNRAMAAASVMTLTDLMRQVQNRTADPLITLRDSIESNLETLRGQIKDIKAQVKRLERAAIRLKFKGEGKNVLAIAIKGAIMKAGHDQLSAERQISFLSDIAVEADKYECGLADAPAQGPSPEKRRNPQISFARAMKETSGPAPEDGPEVWFSTAG